MNQKEKDVRFARCVELVIESLVSHIDYVAEPERESPANREFHLNCVADYTELLCHMVDLWRDNENPDDDSV